MEARVDDSTRGILRPAEGRARFELTRRAPSPDLDAHLERHWVVTWDLRDAEPFVQEILPHPSVNIATEPGLVAVWGIPLRRSQHQIEGAGIAVGTKLRPGGLRGFIPGSVDRLNDRVVPLADLFGEAGGSLGRTLADRAGDPDAQIEATEEFLRRRLPDPDDRYELVSAVAADMLASEPGTTVAELARRHGVTDRTLQRLFRDYVGVGPKWVLRRYRIHEAAERLAAGEAEPGAALALDLGYFDQSHFIRDFRAQIGASPGAYARACASAAARPTAVAEGVDA